MRNFRLFNVFKELDQLREDLIKAKVDAAKDAAIFQDLSNKKEAQIAALNARIATLEAKMAGFQSVTDGLTDYVDGVLEKVKGLQSKIDALENKGRAKKKKPPIRPVMRKPTTKKK